MEPVMTAYWQNVAIILSCQRVVYNLLFLCCVKSNELVDVSSRPGHRRLSAVIRWE